MDSFTKASEELHKASNSYGAAHQYENQNSMKYLLTIDNAIGLAYKARPIKSILDHGTGRGGLVKKINERFHPKIVAEGYDPGTKEFAEKPQKKFDVVTSIDVLEHIGRENLDATLSEIKQFTGQFFFFCIDLLPASKAVPDGRNAHFLIAPPEWWAQQLKIHFPIVTCIEVGRTKKGDRYPMHLFGCATSSMIFFDPMNEFIKGVQLANRQWIWDHEDGRVKAAPFQ